MALQGTISTEDLATLINVSVQRVGQLEQIGILVKQSRGKWAMVAQNRNYIKYCQAGKGGTGKVTAEGDLDPQQEKAKLDVRRREKLEDDIAVARRDLYSRDDVQDVLVRIQKIYANGNSTMTDVLERDAGLTPQQVQIVQGIVDAERDATAAVMEKWNDAR